MSPKTLLALSGGVDSSVAGWLLKQQNIPFAAVYLKNWTPRSKAEGLWQCQQLTDEAVARSVANTLGVSLTCLSFETEYRQQVIEYFFKEYEAGRTPNPDILCNSFIKFGALYDYARKNGFTSITTGHYAQIEKKQGLSYIARAHDQTKDQSYFLSRLNQDQISFLNFPLGNLLKTEVRKIAQSANLISYNKKDSTGICFIGEQAIKPFLQLRLKPQTGNIIEATGKILGQHDGHYYYTIGQRHGLGLKGGTAVYFVTAKDPKQNTLTVSNKPDDLLSTEILASGQLWSSGQKPEFPLKCKACLRYRSELIASEVLETPLGLKIILNQPARAATPGQFIVFYDQDRIIGSAVIEQAK